MAEFFKLSSGPSIARELNVSFEKGGKNYMYNTICFLKNCCVGLLYYTLWEVFLWFQTYTLNLKKKKKKREREQKSKRFA